MPTTNAPDTALIDQAIAQVDALARLAIRIDEAGLENELRQRYLQFLENIDGDRFYFAALELVYTTSKIAARR